MYKLPLTKYSAKLTRMLIENWKNIPTAAMLQNNTDWSDYTAI